VIVADFPALFAEEAGAPKKSIFSRPTPPGIFAEFRGKRFTLLWRGSRDGFRARDFHSRCDGHAPTLTLIRDTKRNIFGGFTPVEWEPRHWNGKYVHGSDNRYKADPSLKSFLFTLKNPHNLPARKFALRAEKKDRAIFCDSSEGPVFGGDICEHADLAVSDRCNFNTDNASCLGIAYANDTGLDGKTVLTGLTHFTVDEVEVFSIID
jgi:hypothetical protein